MERRTAWLASTWAVLWPAAIVLLTLWLLVVSPLVAVVLAIGLCLLGARRALRHEPVFPVWRLVVVGLVLAYVGLWAVQAHGPVGELSGSDSTVETRTETLRPPE